MLADIIIDLRNYSQSGPIRLGKLWHIRMVDDSKGGYKRCRFMTYEGNPGQWVTQESVACFMPPDDLLKQYNELRAAKDKENTEMLSGKYGNETKPKPVLKPRCYKCEGSDVRYLQRTNEWKCKTCGTKWKRESEKSNNIITKQAEA
jgi:hypothetical protein